MLPGKEDQGCTINNDDDDDDGHTYKLLKSPTLTSKYINFRGNRVRYFPIRKEFCFHVIEIKRKMEHR